MDRLNGYITIIKSSGADGARIPLFRGSSAISFGRALDCDVRIQLPTVSRRHVEISVEGESVVLRNLSKSAVSTRVGEEALGPSLSVSLSEGAVFEICERRFRWERAAVDSHEELIRCDDDENTTEELTSDQLTEQHMVVSFAADDESPPAAAAPLIPASVLQAIVLRRRPSISANEQQQASSSKKRKPPPPPPRVRKSTTQQDSTSLATAEEGGGAAQARRPPPPPPPQPRSSSKKRKPPPPPPPRQQQQPSSKGDDVEQATRKRAPPPPPPVARRVGLAEDLRGRLAARRAALQCGSPGSCADDEDDSKPRVPLLERSQNFSANKRKLGASGIFKDRTVKKEAPPVTTVEEEDEEEQPADQESPISTTVEITEGEDEEDDSVLAGPHGQSFASLLRSRLEGTRRRSLTRQEVDERANASFSSVIRTRLEQQQKIRRRSSLMQPPPTVDSAVVEEQLREEDETELRRRMPTPMRLAVEGRRRQDSPVAAPSQMIIRQVTFAPLMAAAAAANSTPRAAKSSSSRRATPRAPTPRPDFNQDDDDEEQFAMPSAGKVVRFALAGSPWTSARKNKGSPILTSSAKKVRAPTPFRRATAGDSDDEEKKEEEKVELHKLSSPLRESIATFRRQGAVSAAVVAVVRKQAGLPCSSSSNKKKKRSVTFAVDQSATKVRPRRSAQTPGPSRNSRQDTTPRSSSSNSAAPSSATSNSSAATEAAEEPIVTTTEKQQPATAGGEEKRTVTFALDQSVAKLRPRRSAQTPGPPRNSRQATTPRSSSSDNSAPSSATSNSSAATSQTEAEEEAIVTTTEEQPATAGRDVAKALFDDDDEEDDDAGEAFDYEKRRRRESIGRLPELSEVWGWLHAVDECAPSAELKRALAEVEKSRRLPELGVAWGWLQRTASDESLDEKMREAACKARRLSIGAMPDHGSAWAAMLGDFIRDDQDEEEATTLGATDLDSLLAELEADLDPSSLAMVQAHAQRLVDAGAEPRLAYSCALDKHQQQQREDQEEEEPLDEASQWLQEVAERDAGAAAAAQKLQSTSVDLGELVDWMESWGPSEEDRKLVALYAAEMADLSKQAYTETFAIALDSFLADPESFRARQEAADDRALRMLHVVVKEQGEEPLLLSQETTPTLTAARLEALDAAWESLEAHEARDEEEADAQTQDGDEEEEEAPPKARTTTSRRGSVCPSAAGDEEEPFGALASSWAQLEDDVKALDSSSEIAKRVAEARRASIAALPGLESAWAWLEALEEDDTGAEEEAEKRRLLVKSAKKARRESFGAMPELAAAWAGLERSRDEDLRQSARSLRAAASDNNNERRESIGDNLGEVLHWMTRASEANLSQQQEEDDGDDDDDDDDAAAASQCEHHYASDVDMEIDEPEANDAATPEEAAAPQLEDDETTAMVICVDDLEEPSFETNNSPLVADEDAAADLEKEVSPVIVEQEEKTDPEPAQLDVADQCAEEEEPSSNKPAVLEEDVPASSPLPEAPPAPLEEQNGEEPHDSPPASPAPAVEEKEDDLLNEPPSSPALEQQIAAEVAPSSEDKETPATAAAPEEEVTTEQQGAVEVAPSSEEKEPTAAAPGEEATTERPAGEEVSSKSKEGEKSVCARPRSSRAVVGCASLMATARPALAEQQQPKEATSSSKKRPVEEEPFDEDSERRAAKKLKVADLKDELSSHGVEASGLKAELVEELVRCRRSRHDQQQQVRLARSVGAPAGTSKKTTKAAPAPEILADDENCGSAAAKEKKKRKNDDENAELDAKLDELHFCAAAKKLKVAELRAALENAGVSTKGKLKPELLQQYIGLNEEKKKRPKLAELQPNCAAA